MEGNVSTTNDVLEMEPKKRLAPPTKVTRQQMLDAFKEMRKLPRYKPNNATEIQKRELLRQPEATAFIKFMLEKKAYPVHAIPQLLIDHGMPRYTIKEINDLLAPSDDTALVSNGSESSVE